LWQRVATTFFAENDMVLLIGADRLGNIESLLRDRGYPDQVHIKGRKPSLQRRWTGSMDRTRLMVLFTDFLGHNVMRNFRRLAKDHGVPVVACRRSTVSLTMALDRLQLTDACVACGGCDRGRYIVRG